MQEYEYANLTGTSTTNTIFLGKGILHSVVINTTASGAIKIYDTGTPTIAVNKIGTIVASAVAGQPFVYDVKVANGLVISLAASSDVTVTYTTG